MAGLAKTDKLLLSTATVMIGALENLNALNVAEHSIGLVKNVSLSAEPGYVEIGQGLTNDTVMSVKNSDQVRVSMEVYEFTARNIAYAAGFDGSGVEFDPITATHLTAGAPTTTTFTATADLSSSFSAGDYIYLQSGVSDVVHIAKLATVAFSSVTTFTVATGFEIPAAAGFGIGTKFGKVQKISLGGSTVQPEVSAKIVGLLPKSNEPVTILLPKVKITRGLALSFSNENFSNMPFELMPYAGIPGDPFYNDFGPAKIHLFPR